MMRSQEPASAVQTSLHFVDDKQSSGTAAQSLGAFEIHGRWNPHATLALHRLHDESGELLGSQLVFQLCEISERDGLGAGQHGTEMLAPEGIAHERQSAASQAVERAFGIQQTAAARVCSSKLDGGFDAFAAGAAEKRLLHASARAPAELVGQFARELGNVALQHRGTAPVQLVFDRVHHGGMVVPEVMNAIAGKKI